MLESHTAMRQSITGFGIITHHHITEMLANKTKKQTKHAYLNVFLKHNHCCTLANKLSIIHSYKNSIVDNHRHMQYYINNQKSNNLAMIYMMLIRYIYTFGHVRNDNDIGYQNANGLCG